MKAYFSNIGYMMCRPNHITRVRYRHIIILTTCRLEDNRNKEMNLFHSSIHYLNFTATFHIWLVLANNKLTKNVFCCFTICDIVLSFIFQVNDGIYLFVIRFLGKTICGSILLFLCLTVLCPIIFTQIGVSMKEPWYEVSMRWLN